MKLIDIESASPIKLPELKNGVKNSIFVSGSEAIAHLPSEWIYHYAQKIFEQLQEHKHHMFSYTIDEIVRYMSEGVTALALSPDNYAFEGFCKVLEWPHQYYQLGELGSLLVNPNCQGKHLGSRLVAATAQTFFATYPHHNSHLFAVVEGHNTPSLGLFKKLGFPVVEDPVKMYGEQIFENWDDPDSKVYDLSVFKQQYGTQSN